VYPAARVMINGVLFLTVTPKPVVMTETPEPEIIGAKDIFPEESTMIVENPVPTFAAGNFKS
jgi:hypothetical protein